jgi:hypothetical protein
LVLEWLLLRQVPIQSKHVLSLQHLGPKVFGPEPVTVRFGQKFAKAINHFGGRQIAAQHGSPQPWKAGGLVLEI